VPWIFPDASAFVIIFQASFSLDNAGHPQNRRQGVNGLPARLLVILSDALCQ
jgi:hypothetical protein